MWPDDIFSALPPRDFRTVGERSRKGSDLGKTVGMHRRTFIGLVFALVLAGCSSGPSTTGGTDSKSSATADGKKLRIGFIPKGTTHEFWKGMQAGAEKAAGENNVDLTWKGPLKEDDREEQIKVVENFVAEHVDGIVLAPLDEQALKNPVKEAQAAGISVIIVDSALKDTPTVSFIATDNFQAGKRGGEKLAKALGNKGRVIMLRYAEGSASTMAREEGFMQAVKDAGLQVVSEEQHGGATRESAQSASENLLARFKKGDGLEVDGIFCPNESTTFGMLRALQNAKLAGKVKFVGFDSSKELVAAVEAGEIEGLVIQNPFKMGYEAVTKMVAHLKKEDVQAKIDTGATLVDKANLTTPEVAALLGAK